jgi:hypothetical protein
LSSSKPDVDVVMAHDMKEFLSISASQDFTNPHTRVASCFHPLCIHAGTAMYRNWSACNFWSKHSIPHLVLEWIQCSHLEVWRSTSYTPHEPLRLCGSNKHPTVVVSCWKTVAQWWCKGNLSSFIQPFRLKRMTIPEDHVPLPLRMTFLNFINSSFCLHHSLILIWYLL